MYLSNLLIDVGNNPDRPRPGRLWIRNLYRVHQRLSMAFPSREQREKDRQFLLPFNPANFERARFLFRIDNTIEDDCPRAVILVQSDSKPDWDYAFHNARMFLAAQPEYREYDPAFPAGKELRFRIRVNLSKKGRTSKHGDDLRKPKTGTDSKGRQKDQGKRVALTWDQSQQPDEVVSEWFAKKAWTRNDGEKESVKAFDLRSCNLLQLGWVAGYRTEREGGRPMKFRSALLEGTLAVADAQAFLEVIASGIGSAKGFGFGLLSLAPARCS